VRADETAVFLENGCHGVFLARQRARTLRRRLAQPGGECGITEHGADSVGERSGASGGNEQRCFGPGEIRNAADPCGHDRPPGSERLLQNERLALPAARHDENVGYRQQRGHIIPVPEKPHCYA